MATAIDKNALTQLRKKVEREVALLRATFAWDPDLFKLDARTKSHTAVKAAQRQMERRSSKLTNRRFGGQSTRRPTGSRFQQAAGT